ncbi:MAG: pseudouridine-5'-phosphate glycosidase [Candidatus Nanopelagicales bacterium]|nr:pseudouridine-5'-phosphate glycosidase [Candidatus Nanopelagicales bacterium]
MTSPIHVAPAVATALAEGAPVVALESTIITHGLPRPRNLEVALDGEARIRAAGAVPATIGVHRGVPTVGLTPTQLEELAVDDTVMKASTRELALAAVIGASAGTTIAATAFLARAAGIDVFATGGLGGVHHGAATTFDESADLVAMARTSIVLVSSGAKAILDIAATLERFETLGVPVVGYRTDRYPGFYVVDSGYPVPARLDSPAQVAALLRTHRALGASSGVLVANPIPVADQLDPAELDVVVAQAWADAEAAGIGGQAATPFLLDAIRRATDGRSLEANVALYRHNIALAVEVARELAASAP